MLPCTHAFRCTHNKTLNSFLFKGEYCKTCQNFVAVLVRQTELLSETLSEDRSLIFGGDWELTYQERMRLLIARGAGLMYLLMPGLQQTQPPATVREIWAARRRKAAMIDRDKAGLLGTLHLFSSSIHTSWSACIDQYRHRIITSRSAQFCCSSVEIIELACFQKSLHVSFSGSKFFLVLLQDRWQQHDWYDLTETRFLSAEKPMIAATVPTIAPTAAIIVTFSGYRVPSAIPPKFCCKLNLKVRSSRPTNSSLKCLSPSLPFFLPILDTDLKTFNRSFLAWSHSTYQETPDLNDEAVFLKSWSGLPSTWSQSFALVQCTDTWQDLFEESILVLLAIIIFLQAFVVIY